MDTFEELANEWKKGMAQHPLSPDELKVILQTRLSRQRKTVMEYFWSAFFYQNLLYGAAAYFSLRYWGDFSILISCLVLVILHAPFTFIMMKRFKSMIPHDRNETGSSSVQGYIHRLHAGLSLFYCFKKRFDLFSIPISCLVIVVVLFSLFTEGIFNHVYGASLVFSFWLLIFVAAAYRENQKKFRLPILQLDKMLDELYKE